MHFPLWITSESSPGFVRFITIHVHVIIFLFVFIYLEMQPVDMNDITWVTYFTSFIKPKEQRHPSSCAWQN